MKPNNNQRSPCFLLYLSALLMGGLLAACIYYRLSDRVFYCLSLGLFFGIVGSYIGYLWLLGSPANSLTKAFHKLVCRLYGHSECPEHRRYMGVGTCTRCSEMAYDKKYIKAETSSGFLPDHEKWEYYGLFQRMARSFGRMCRSISSFMDKRLRERYSPDDLPF